MNYLPRAIVKGGRKENMAESLMIPTHMPFISPEPKLGDPPQSDWAAFEKPQLRRYPDPDGIRLRDFLGRGKEGFVFRAKTQTGDEVAVKFVRAYTFIGPSRILAKYK